MDLRGKVVVVTGGGAGIGQQLVLQLLERGAEVAAVDLREEALKETAALAGEGAKLSLHLLDVTNHSACEALPSGVRDAHGQVDVVINNAGVIQPFVRLNDLDFDAIDRVMNVNFYGTLYMVKAFLPHLLERPEAHVCNVSSMGGFLPVPGQAIYGAAKAAVKLMTEALYAELIDSSVSVSCVMPGGVETDIATNSGAAVTQDVEEGGSYPMTSPEKAAEVILDGIQDEDLHILVGNDARLMNLAHRLAPEGSIRLIQRQMRDLLPE